MEDQLNAKESMLKRQGEEEKAATDDRDSLLDKIKELEL